MPTGLGGWHRRQACRRPQPITATAARTELALGTTLLGLAALGGLFFFRRPGPTRLDTVLFALLPPQYDSAWAHGVTHVGSLPGLVVGVLVLVAAGLARDRVRTIACASAPVMAVLIVELAKPLVGRHLSSYGGASYPSGTVTAVAALALGIILVVPAVLRLLAAVFGSTLVTATCAAVIVLRWHFPTDAAGGICVGAGVVLVADGVLHLPSVSRLMRRLAPAPGP